MSATLSSGSKAAAPAATAPTAKPKFKTKVDKSKPAAAKASPASNAASAVSLSTQAMAVRDKANTGESAASAIVPHAGKKTKFSILHPGVNGAIAGVLDGKRFVLTGVFPELVRFFIEMTNAMCFVCVCLCVCIIRIISHPHS
mmetsp:Transcript_2375/g.5235  ORF Transcript_2375/g.5235 Transcript_2375/m.5235 type:complete len:143 (+) Transcript_2375:1136-1564(+)